MKKIRAAIVGYGNIGKYVLDALEASSDFEVAGVVRRNAKDIPAELKLYTVTDSISKLKKVDVAILATPTRQQIFIINAVFGNNLFIFQKVPSGIKIRKRNAAAENFFESFVRIQCHFFGAAGIIQMNIFKIGNRLNNIFQSELN